MTLQDAANLIKPKVRVQREPFDTGAEVQKLQDGRTDIGAVVSFTGYCRDEDGALQALELEHYPGMAEQALLAIAKDAATRWAVQAVTLVHRFGRLRPAEPIVLVAVASKHREDAFQSANFIMDYLKTDAPFWKKEHPIDAAKEPSWVAAKAADDQSRQRWKDKA